jgi:hypothetical protein
VCTKFSLEENVAKAIRKRERRRLSKDETLPLARENFMIMGAGLVCIVFGYLAMLQGGVEGFLAPILLVLGYCVLIPVGILYKKSPPKRETSVQGLPSSAA